MVRVPFWVPPLPPLSHDAAEVASTVTHQAQAVSIPNSRSTASICVQGWIANLTLEHVATQGRRTLRRSRCDGIPMRTRDDLHPYQIGHIRFLA